MSRSILALGAALALSLAPGCVWLTCDISESTTSTPGDEGDPVPVRLEASAEPSGEAAITLRASEVATVTKTVERTIERESDFDVEWKSYAVDFAGENEAIVVLFGFPIVLAFDLVAPIFQWSYQLIRGTFGGIDGSEGESTETEERTAPLAEAELTSPVVGSSARWALGPQPPGGWTLRRDDLLANGLEGDRVVVEAPSGLRASVSVPPPGPALPGPPAPVGATPPVGATGPVQPPAAPTGFLVVENAAGQTASYLYATADVDAGWGPDRLGTRVLAAGERVTVSLPAGRYFVKVVLADGSTLAGLEASAVEVGAETLVRLGTAAHTGQLVLVNHTALTVRAVRFVSEGQALAGPDRLDADEDLAPGARRAWSLPSGQRYRVQVELEDGRSVQVGDAHPVDEGGETVVALTADDL